MSSGISNSHRCPSTLLWTRAGLSRSGVCTTWCGSTSVITPWCWSQAPRGQSPNRPGSHCVKLRSSSPRTAGRSVPQRGAPDRSAAGTVGRRPPAPQHVTGNELAARLRGGRQLELSQIRAVVLAVPPLHQSVRSRGVEAATVVLSRRTSPTAANRRAPPQSAATVSPPASPSQQSPPACAARAPSGRR